MKLFLSGLMLCIIVSAALKASEENEEIIQYATLNLNNKKYAATIYKHPRYRMYVVEKFYGYAALLCGKFIINNKECYSGMLRKGHREVILITSTARIFKYLEYASKRKFITTKIDW